MLSKEQIKALIAELLERELRRTEEGQASTSVAVLQELASKIEKE